MTLRDQIEQETLRPMTIRGRTTQETAEKLRIRQQNTNRSNVAMQYLLNDEDETEDILAIQEPYIDHLNNMRSSPQWIPVLPSTHLKDGAAKSRSYMLINRRIPRTKWDPIRVDSADITAIRMRTQRGDILIFNIYGDQEHSDEFQQLAEATRHEWDKTPPRKKGGIIWLGDFNRHHPM